MNIRSLIFSILLLFKLVLLIVCTRNEHRSYQPNNNDDDEQTTLSEEDFAAAAQFEHHEYSDDDEHEHVDDSEMYHSSRFEGDIVNPGLSKQTLDSFMGKSSNQYDDNGIQRNAINDKFRLWPHARIPYTISTQYSSTERAQLAEAIQEFHKRTCVRFVAKSDSDRDYIFITPLDGCYSRVGRSGEGGQQVSLGSGCMFKGIIIHELMHTLGFFHEQSRNDRDEYVNIIWDNIEEDRHDQFEKYSLDLITHLGTPYDYGSVMHYPKKAFSKNGRAVTIEPKWDGIEIGQRKGLSDNDVVKINKLYNCSSRRGDGDDGDGDVVEAPEPPPPLPTKKARTKRPPYTGSFVCDEDGSFSDPASCSRFYRCVLGIAFHFHCRPGLRYNSETKKCVWPRMSNCVPSNDH